MTEHSNPAQPNKLQRSKAMGWAALGAGVGVAISLGFSALAERQNTALNLPIEEVRMLSEVYGRIKSDYVETVDDKRLIKEAINGMLTGLDPHSQFLDPDAFKEMQSVTTGKFSGLGIEVGTEDGLVKVISPIDDSPAYKAGIKAGDYLLKVGDVNLRGMNVNEAVKKLRGDVGTEAVLTVGRRGEGKELVITVRRAEIQLQSVRARQLEPGYAAVRISQFEDATPEKLVRAVNDAFKQNEAGLKGLILDLRNDPGGLLNASVAVSAAFLPKDVLVVYTDGRLEESKLRLSARKEDYVRGNREDPLAQLNPAARSVPLLVLVNNGSASASEIVAGALQDHGRAKVMGTQTFGKGSVQTILPLNNNTAIKLTTARYYTPNGRSIQAKGIQPDVVVDDGFQRLALREADLEHHLQNESESKDGTTPAKAEKLVPDTPPKAAADEKPVEYKPLTGQDGRPIDFVLQQALYHLKGLPVAASPRAWQLAQAKTDKVQTAAVKGESAN